MIERVAIALANNFKAQVEANADMPFAETKVSMPTELIWITYAVAAIKAMREPTEKMMVEMERAEPQLECFLEKEKSPSYLVWIAAIDAIIND